MALITVKKNLPNITAVECSRRGNFEKVPQVSLPTKHHRRRMLIRKVAISSTLTRLCIANNKQGPRRRQRSLFGFAFQKQRNGNRRSGKAKHHRGSMLKEKVKKKLILHDLPANYAGLLRYNNRVNWFFTLGDETVVYLPQEFLLLEIDKDNEKPRRNRRIVFLRTSTSTNNRRKENENEMSKSMNQCSSSQHEMQNQRKMEKIEEPASPSCKATAECDRISIQ
ncbi:unnamed protein product, partial [Mesorhabditis spiculigera]